MRTGCQEDKRTRDTSTKLNSLDVARFETLFRGQVPNSRKFCQPRHFSSKPVGGGLMQRSRALGAEQMEDLMAQDDPLHQFARPVGALEFIESPRVDGQPSGMQIEKGAKAHPGDFMLALADLPLDAALLQAVFQAGVALEPLSTTIDPGADLHYLGLAERLPMALPPPALHLFFFHRGGLPSIGSKLASFMKISKTFLLGSAYHWEQMPKPELPEFAFVGRSNVGKSSLINMLVGRRLAYTSNTPGKTRLMHFYMVNHHYVLVDLPGYGYAKVSQTDRAHWEARLLRYLKERSNMTCAVHLIDARHGPLENDLEMGRWMWQQDIRRCVVLTKTDKISKNAVAGVAQKAAESLRLDRSLVIPVSAEKGKGRDELWRHLTAQKLVSSE